MIRDDGWQRYSIWEHSSTVRDLYTRRCRREVEEMTAHAQAAEFLTPLVSADDTLLDAGCGSGYFFHSLQQRELPIEYYGIDASPTLIGIGQRELEPYGLQPERLRVLRIEDLDGEADHVVCINVLSNIDNYHRPLERLLRVARKSVILRESITTRADYRYVRDAYLDEGVELSVHVNAYARDEVEAFVESRGYMARYVEDRHSGGQPELVIDHPHHWTFLIARKRG